MVNLIFWLEGPQQPMIQCAVEMSMYLVKCQHYNFFIFANLLAVQLRLFTRTTDESFAIGANAIVNSCKLTFIAEFFVDSIDNICKDIK